LLFIVGDLGGNNRTDPGSYHTIRQTGHAFIFHDSSVLEARTKELGVRGSSTSHYAGCGLSLSNDTIFLASSVGWGHKKSISFIGTVLRASKRTRVAVVEFSGISVSKCGISVLSSVCTIHV